MAKLKDGFYKLTASSIGSDLLVLLAGGGAKPIADFATTTDLSGYLPLTGGTLIGIDPILTLNCTDASPRIVFKQNGTTKGSIRFNDNNLLSVLPKNSPTWYEFLHTGNYSSYALPKDGNAVSATKLQTARTIWGQSFDGSGNIDGTLTINGTYGSYTQGIRIKPASDGWSTILLGGTDLTSDSGTSANSWSIHSYSGNFYINRNGASTSTGYELCNYNGNWGIGTMSPSYKLTVSGITYTDKSLIAISSTDANKYAGDPKYYHLAIGSKPTSNGASILLYRADTTTQHAIIWCTDSGDHAGISVDSGSNDLSIWNNKSVIKIGRGLFTAANSGNSSPYNYTTAAVQIREYNYASSQSDTWGNAPRLAWHWAGRTAAQIGLASNGLLYYHSIDESTIARLVYESGTWAININGNADTVDGYHASSFEGYYAYTIDATSLNNNTWYPVTLSIGNSTLTRIRVQGHSSANASWNGRADKNMAVILDYTVNGSLWGWTLIHRVVHRFELGAGASGSNCIAGLGLLSNSSTEYVYVRGGAVYVFYISRAIQPALRTSTYTVSNQSVGPTTSSPGGITLGYHSFSLFASQFYENSDAKLKTNIETINTADNIPQLKQFDWRSDGKHSYGLIAQELEAMGYSELVENSGDHKTVNYSAALSLIVGKLQVKIKELEKEIENLKNKN